MSDDALISPGAVVEPIITWLNANAHGLFQAITTATEAVLAGVETLLLAAPGPVFALAATLVVLWWRGGRLAGLVAGAATVALASGLWDATMKTVALVSVSVACAVLVAFPLGVLAARRPRLEAALRPVLDLMQTVPPWVYLIPAVMLFSLGKVPALIATVIYAIPPMLRLTILGLRQVPRELVELGEATGATRWQSLVKVELPAARETLALGLNQAILLSLAMVVLAGLVGAGGLGAEVTRGLTRMEMGLGLRSGLAIVAVAIALDRLTRAAVATPADKRA